MLLQKWSWKAETSLQTIKKVKEIKTYCCSLTETNIFLWISYPGYTDYEQIYKAIRSGEVDYGLINSDIAAYQQLVWNEGGIQSRDYLAVFKTLPIPTAVKQEFLGIYKDTEYEANCFNDYTGIEEEAIAKYRKKVQVHSFYS